MKRLIKKIRNNGEVTFDSGTFDNWCVYLKRPNKKRFAPTDTMYFSRLEKLAEKYDGQRIYDDFLIIYDLTDKEINSVALRIIEEIADTYNEDIVEVEEWLTVIYGGMIAEENKEKAILKKRIKRLGMYQTLIEGIGAEKAAHFSRGKKWKELDAIMKERGI